MPQAKFLQKSIIDLNIGTYLGVEVFINYYFEYIDILLRHSVIEFCKTKAVFRLPMKRLL